MQEVTRYEKLHETNKNMIGIKINLALLISKLLNASLFILEIVF